MDRITSRQLLGLMDCKKKYKLENLSLKGVNERRLSFHKALMGLVNGYALQKPWEAVYKEIEDFLGESYKEEWFLLKWQKEKAISHDLALMGRLWQWMPKREGEKALTNVSVELPCSFSLYDEEINAIGGKADLLLTNGRRIHGYIFGRNFSKPYSYYARRKDHKVTGSIELLVLLAGLRAAYPDAESIEVSLVRLVSPADKGDNLADFNHKKGENVITLTEEMAAKECPGGIVEHIRHLVEEAEPVTCRECGFRAICRKAYQAGVRTETAQKEERNKKLSFSPVQKEVIAHGKGPIRVCAGPGSGKTAVLVERVKELAKSGVAPERILAVTFTKKAAQEMAERIGMEGSRVSTLHALAFGILTEQEYLIGPVRLAGKVDCKNLLIKILNYAPIIQGVSYEGLTMQYGLISSLLKDFDYLGKNGQEAFAAAFPKKDLQGIVQVKQLYDAAFHIKGYITYDDQVSMAVRLLKKYPGILEDVRSAYDYIMVDEVQDLDATQAEFVCLLAGPGYANLMICGDSDQSIYSFRGGSNQFMLDFPAIFPGAADIWMEDNYRSSKEIVDMAAAFIAHNAKRVPMTVKSAFSTGFYPIYIPRFQERHMAKLVREICSKGYFYGDIAIIARTNQSLIRLCELAEKEAVASGNAVPMEKPKYYLREDYAFQFLLNLLELYVKGLHQDAALYRLLSWMGVEAEKEDKSLSIYEDYLKRGLIYDFSGEEAGSYWLEKEETLLQAAFGRIYIGLQLLKLPVKEAVNSIFEKFIKEEMFSKEVLQKLTDMLYEKKIKDAGQLYEVLSAMALFEDDTRIYYQDGDTDQVHLLTAHDAKGKEFPVVILYGVDEFESGDPEEDRRLLYVAMTRAKRVLLMLESYPGKSSTLKELQDFITINRRERYEK